MVYNPLLSPEVVKLLPLGEVRKGTTYKLKVKIHQASIFTKPVKDGVGFLTKYYIFKTLLPTKIHFHARF